MDDGKNRVGFVYLYPVPELGKIVDPICAKSITVEDCPALQPGQIVWINDAKMVPIVTGGGCIFIEGSFDISKNLVLDIKCNGSI